MIVFDLECYAGGHRFEGWFGSSDDFNTQQKRGLIACPVCGGTDVTKAVMAPHVGRKGNQLPEPARAAPHSISGMTSPRPDEHQVPAQSANQKIPAMVDGHPLPPQTVAMLRTVAAIQAEALKSSTWVGKNFADDARAMHYGEKDTAPIHGEASPDEARALIDEGIDIAPILFPIVPPGEVN